MARGEVTLGLAAAVVAETPRVVGLVAVEAVPDTGRDLVVVVTFEDKGLRAVVEVVVVRVAVIGLAVKVLVVDVEVTEVFAVDVEVTERTVDVPDVVFVVDLCIEVTLVVGGLRAPATPAAEAAILIGFFSATETALLGLVGPVLGLAAIPVVVLGAEVFLIEDAVAVDGFVFKVPAIAFDVGFFVSSDFALVDTAGVFSAREATTGAT